MKNILLVEDEQFLARLLGNRLEKAGFHVQTARDGEEALEFVKEKKFDLILLDLILPKVPGFEVLEKIHTNPQFQNIPVVILSNLGQESDITQGQALGAVGYFIKARTSIEELTEQVKKFLKV